MKPADFLLGLLDFFAILLPGAVATWLAGRYLDPATAQRLLHLAGEPLSETARWAAFLISSYLLGHFVFMVSAWIDPLYDRWRARAKPTEGDKAYEAARVLRAKVNPELEGAEFTLLKWAKAFVLVRSPAARLDIDRLEAASKLFRSFVVISAATALHFLLRERRPGLALAAAAIGAVSYRRFVDQRWKMTELAYGTAAILGGCKGPGPKGGPAEADGEA